MTTPYGKPIEPSDTIAPAAFGAVLGIILLALAGIPYLLSLPGSSAGPDLGAISGRPLAGDDVRAINTMVRARFAQSGTTRQLSGSVAWGATARVGSVNVLSKDQAESSDIDPAAVTLRAVIRANQPAGYARYAIAVVQWTSAGYLRDASGKRGAVQTSPQTRVAYIGYGKRDGNWYELTPGR